MQVANTVPIQPGREVPNDYLYGRPGSFQNRFLQPNFAPDDGAGGAGGGGGGDDKPKDKTFTQDDVNRIVQNEKRTLTKDVETANAKVKKVFEILELEDDANLEDVLAGLKKGNNADPKKKKDEADKPIGLSDDEVRQRLTKAEQKVHDSYKPVLDKVQSLERKVMGGEIGIAAAEVGAYKAEDFIDKLLPRARYDSETGEVYYVDDKGNALKNEKMLPYTTEEMVAQIAEENPHLVRSGAHPGSGGGGSQNGSPLKGVNPGKMTPEQYKAWRQGKNG